VRKPSAASRRAQVGGRRSVPLRPISSGAKDVAKRTGTAALDSLRLVKTAVAPAVDAIPQPKDVLERRAKSQ
jgi:hypothetical protein